MTTMDDIIRKEKFTREERLALTERVECVSELPACAAYGHIVTFNGSLYGCSCDGARTIEERRNEYWGSQGATAS